MKTKIALAAAFVAFVGNASAAVYAYSNGAAATASGIQTLSGGTFSSTVAAGTAFSNGGGTSAGPGIFAVGIFSTDDFSSVSSATQLISLFTNFGGASGPSAVSGPVGARSIFSLSSPAVTVTGSQFAGKSMYMFVGNGTTFSNSSEFLVFKSNTLFSAADDSSPTAISVAFAPANGTTLLGTNVANVKTTNSDTSINAGWQTAALVPEPSAALLGALGALGLLRRRRA